ncbi:MAG: DNA alkylation repair protein [Clostridiales bacterium]|nr:DNA alkylation repair protein [Clostridiales bacterium]
MNHSELTAHLFALQDLNYRQLQIRTIPGMDPDSIIGVRTPDLRSIARKLKGMDLASEILSDTDHNYFEEYQIHAFLLSMEKDIGKCFSELDLFLPHVNNWATCDQMIPKVFAKHHDILAGKALEWIGSSHTYTRRFGIKVLMDHFLDNDFDISYPEVVASVDTDEYYLQMMIAWYFATALTKQYDQTIHFMEDKRLSPVVHKMTVRKCLDSFRISEDRKSYIRSL